MYLYSIIHAVEVECLHALIKMHYFQTGYNIYHKHEERSKIIQWVASVIFKKKTKVVQNQIVTSACVTCDQKKAQYIIIQRVK